MPVHPSRSTTAPRVVWFKWTSHDVSGQTESHLVGARPFEEGFPPQIHMFQEVRSRIKPKLHWILVAHGKPFEKDSTSSLELGLGSTLSGSLHRIGAYWGSGQQSRLLCQVALINHEEVRRVGARISRVGDIVRYSWNIPPLIVL